MKFVFDVMEIDKLIVFVNERNQYFYKLLLYVGFRLIKMKPKNHGEDNRLMLSIIREDYEKVISTKSYNRIIKNKFYNNYLQNAQRDKIGSSLSTNSGFMKRNIGTITPLIKVTPNSKSEKNGYQLHTINEEYSSAPQYIKKNRSSESLPMTKVPNSKILAQMNIQEQI